MKNHHIIVLTTAGLLAACGGETTKEESTKMQAPAAEKQPKELTIHCHTRVDNYFWLNDREDEKVIKYLEGENAYTEEVLKDTEKFQEDLYQEMRGRIKEDDSSVPYKENGYFYYTRYEEEEYQSLQKKRLDGSQRR